MSYDFSYNDEFVFLLDGTKQMYESGSIQQCIKTYHEIVRGKCSYNKRDNLGLILFGTKDTNCQIDNITLLQKLEPVSVETLKNIQGIVNTGISKYREQALDSNVKYPLYDALEYAFQVAKSSETKTNSQKIIILCTCKGDPPKDELVRVEHLVDKVFKDWNTKLCVIGLTDSYDDSVFYNKLQIMSGSCSDGNYEPMSLKDLENYILYSTKSICKLPWTISPDIVVPVKLLSLFLTPNYPSKVKLNKSTNEILEAQTVIKLDAVEEDAVVNASWDSKGVDKKVVTSDELAYYKTFGAEDIHFKPEERMKMKNAGLQPEIKVLAFKPILYHPLFHSRNIDFVSYSDEADEDSKNFFRAFVSRCTAKKVMPICKVVTKDSVLICKMIPCHDCGGFYMCKIPFNNCVRDFTSLLPAYMYNEENKCPINKDAFYMFKKLTKDMEIKFDLEKFSNPKLENLNAYLEALALGNKLTSRPSDKTLPPALPEKLTKLKTALMKKLKLHDVKTVRKRPLAPEEDEESASKKAKID